MRWGTRTVLAGTASVALASAGALGAGCAAHGPSPAATPAVSNDEAQVAALARQARELRAQVAGLEAAAGRAPLATEAPNPTEPAQLPTESARSSSPADPPPADPSPAAAPESPSAPVPTVAASEQAHEPEPEPAEHEPGGYEYGALDD